MLISQRLEQLARQHDDARRVVGVFLIENADRFDQLTMADIAAETYTSKPTLVRVAKQLGYSGWRAFSAAYAREIDRQRQIDSSVDHSLPFGDGAFARDIAHSIAQVRAESTLLTAERLDIADLERACEMLLSAQRIFLMGYGFNQPMLESFSRKLFQIGITAIMPAEDNFAHTAKRAHKGDCLVIASYAGSSTASNLLRYLPDARAGGAKVLAITSEGDNFLRAHADTTLTILTRERLYAKIGTFSTEASTAFLLDALYGCIFARDYRRNLDDKTGFSQATETNRTGIKP